MKKSLLSYILIFGFIVIAGFLLFKGSKPELFEAEKKIVRQPAVAGQFYPADSQELEKEVNQFLAQAESSQTEGEIIALILPHAGYQFSGQVAAYGFKELVNEQIDTVILIGSSHYERFEGISVFKEGFYKTPLGEIEIDSQLAQEIIDENERIFFRESAHQKEHALEVELPFLQKTLKDFKILPIIFGNSSSKDYQILAQALLKHIKEKNVLLIASSDLSHYPSYEDTKYVDSKTIQAILSGDIEELDKTIQDLEKESIPQVVTFACGLEAIKTVILVAEELGAGEIKLLKYANSGDVSGDKSRVVGYAAIGFFAQRRDNLLNKEEKEKLLEIARASVETFVKQGKMPEFQIENPILNQNLGAFVTLRKEGQLRGCIGRFSPTDIPLYQVVSQMAIAAATEDRRFYPIAVSELKDLKYEISVLSVLEKINNWREIEVGKHGVQIRKGLRGGVFLPQVAAENNWNLEKFMGELCFQKAGLEWDCWKKEDIELYTFTAQVFGEKEDQDY